MSEKAEDFVSRIEEYSFRREFDPKAVIQDFSDQVRELRQQLNLSVEEFCTKYNISAAEIRLAEMARGVEPPLKLKLLINLIKSDPNRVARLVEQVRREQK